MAYSRIVGRTRTVKLFLARKLVQRDLRGPGQDVAAQHEGETTGPKVGSPEGAALDLSRQRRC
jgi:hypothetical protein